MTRPTITARRPYLGNSAEGLKLRAAGVLLGSSTVLTWASADDRLGRDTGRGDPQVQSTTTGSALGFGKPPVGMEG